MKRLLAVAACALTLPALAETVTETRTLDARVQKLVIDGVATVRVRQGATPSLSVRADKADLGKITTVVEGNVLKIGNNSHVSYSNGNKTTEIKEMKVEIVLPQLSSVIAGGVGESDVQGFAGDSLEVELKGAGSLRLAGSYRDVRSTLSGLGKLKLELNSNQHTSLRLSGAGEAELLGRAQEFEADLSGLGGINARKFETENLKLKVSGTGGAVAWAKKSAAVAMSGIGSATIYGNPATRSVASTGISGVEWK